MTHQTRKLSEIIIEIAMQGLTHEKYAHSEVINPLMFLAHVAWNRDVGSSDYLAEVYQRELRKFPISKKALKRELISADWDVILNKMIEYKKERFPDDKRLITVCGYTPRKTFRVEWE